jgi:enoyl-CoA hydratase/carnithine racemase
MFEAVLLSIAGPVATITMNRPKRRNAFNVQMYNDLIASLKQCEENSEVAAVVLTGSGGASLLRHDFLQIQAMLSGLREMQTTSQVVRTLVTWRRLKGILEMDPWDSL